MPPISPTGCRSRRSLSDGNCVWRPSPRRKRRSRRERKSAWSASKVNIRPIWPRAEQEKRTGKKPRGRPPEPPTGGVQEKDQINLTDEDSRIMPAAGGGFDQSYNAQAAVATGSLLIVATEVTQAANDKQQL